LKIKILLLNDGYLWSKLFAELFEVIILVFGNL